MASLELPDNGVMTGSSTNATTAVKVEELSPAGDDERISGSGGRSNSPSLPPSPSLEAEKETTVTTTPKTLYTSPQTRNDKDEPEPPYSVLPLSYRWYITILLGYMCLASSLTANLYFPMLQLLADWYGTSVAAINLTITMYIVVQGITPAIFASMCDTLGRRPVCLLSFGIYTASSVGLFFSGHSYATLLAMRMLQSAGGSAMLSICYAIVADYTVNSEKGKFTVPMMTTTNLGNVVGPILGGSILLATADPRWPFMALIVFGASALLLTGFTLPETNRTIVGNGAVPARGMWKLWVAGRPASKLKRLTKANKADQENQGPRHLDHKDNAVATGKGRFVIPNPLHSVQLFFYGDIALTLLLAASPYGAWYSITTGIPLMYGDVYRFDSLRVGLCYLPGGCGVIAGGFVAAQVLDRAYVRTAKRHGLSVDRKSGDSVHSFPIEEARTTGTALMAILSGQFFIAIGWAVRYQVHPAASLILQFNMGCLCTVLHQVYSALAIETVTPRGEGKNLSGTVGGSNNLCRCTLAAVTVAVLKPLVDAMDWGWFYTMIGLLHTALSLAGVWMLRKHGRGWRRARVENWHERPPAYLRKR